MIVTMVKVNVVLYANILVRQMNGKPVQKVVIEIKKQINIMVV